MEELKSAMEAHLDQMADLVQKLSSELRSGFRPAIDNFIGFFHAIDWTEPWLMGLIGLHLVLLVLTVVSRRHINFQMCLFLFACFTNCQIKACFWVITQVFPKINLLTADQLVLIMVHNAKKRTSSLYHCWRSFASQNYFDPHGVFLSVVWSGPLLIIATIILINSLFSLCYMIVRCKRAELRHRARLARESNKQD